MLDVTQRKRNLVLLKETLLIRSGMASKEVIEMTDFLSKDEIIEYNQIIDNLYSYYNYEEALQNFLINIKNLVFYEKGDIYIYKKKGSHIYYESYISVGYGQELDSYKQEYCEIDDVLPLISVPQPLMFRSSDIFLTGEREKTNYYQNHLDPAKMHHSIEGNIYVEKDGYVVGLGIHKSRNHEDFSLKELEIMKLTRPHLSRISQKFCESKSNATKIFDTSSTLSETDNVGVWVWDWQVELAKENIGDNEFIHVHEDEIKNILQKLCLSIKSNINKGGDSIEFPYRMKSKIIISEKSYYVDIVYRPKIGEERGVFVAILYDYMGIINNIMFEMKDKFCLTEREYDVFQCMVDGMSNQEIQDHLFISMPTVKKHLTNIYQKLGVEGRHQLIHSIL